MTGRDARCWSRHSARFEDGQDSGGDGQDFGACQKPTGQDFGQDAGRIVTGMPDNDHDPESLGQLEAAFGPPNLRRVLQHLLAFHQGSTVQQVDEKTLAAQVAGGFRVTGDESRGAGQQDGPEPSRSSRNEATVIEMKPTAAQLHHLAERPVEQARELVAQHRPCATEAQSPTSDLLDDQTFVAWP